MSVKASNVVERRSIPETTSEEGGRSDFHLETAAKLLILLKRLSTGFSKYDL